MNITDVKVRLIAKEDSKLKAVVSLVIDGCFAVHDVKVIQNENGRIIAMPARKTENGTYRDIIHPINKETRDALTELILAEYDKAISEL